jgi:hypothetical protein
VLQEGDVDAVQEEWRCCGCFEWFNRDAVTLLEFGRSVAEMPEVSAYCIPCAQSVARPRRQVRLSS